MGKLIGIILILFSLISKAQSPIDKALVFWQEMNNQEIELEEFTNNLQFYLEHPLNVNNLTLEQIQNFPLINLKQFLIIQHFKQKNGDYFSIQEFYLLPQFSKLYVEILAPFISFTPSIEKEKLRLYFLSRIIIKPENTKGFLKSDSSGYLGSKLHLYNRFQIKSKSQRGFISWEKDKGEISFIGNTYKYGYQRNVKGIIKQINLGSFSAHIGEGLIHSNNFIIGKTNPIESFQAITAPIKINSGASEYNFENGIAVMSRYKSISNTSFYSRKIINGEIENGAIKSIKSDGLYNTYSQLEKKNIGAISTYGALTQFKCNKTIIGYNFTFKSFSSEYKPPDTYYNKNYGLDAYNLNQSLNYKFLSNKWLLRGELAIDKELNKASNHFFSFSPDDDFNILINMRSFSSKYKSYQSSTFSETSRVQNEKGVYFAAEWNLPSLKLYSSIDFFSHQTPKYLVHLPSQGKEFTLFGNWRINDSTSLKLFYKIEQKEEDDNSLILDKLTGRTSQHLYAYFKIRLTENLRFISRFDFTTYQKKSEVYKGQAAYFDFIYRKKKHQFASRLAWIDTENWQTRIYAYEYDMLYNFSIPAYYDESFRYYINYSFKPTSKVQFWIKYGRTIFPQKTTIGSGLEELEGSYKSELKTQVRVRF